MTINSCQIYIKYIKVVEAKRNQTIANKDKSRMFLGRQSKYFPRQIKAKACNNTKNNCIKNISVPLNPIHPNNLLSAESLQLIIHFP